MELLTLLYLQTLWNTSVLVPRSPTPRASRTILLLLWMTRSIRCPTFKPWISLAKLSVTDFKGKSVRAGLWFLCIHTLPFYMRTQGTSAKRVCSTTGNPVGQIKFRSYKVTCSEHRYEAGGCGNVRWPASVLSRVEDTEEQADNGHRVWWALVEARRD